MSISLGKELCTLALRTVSISILGDIENAINA